MRDSSDASVLANALAGGIAIEVVGSSAGYVVEANSLGGGSVTHPQTGTMELE